VTLVTGSANQRPNLKFGDRFRRHVLLQVRVPKLRVRKRKPGLQGDRLAQM
jgi:hypothetical protein